MKRRILFILVITGLSLLTPPSRQRISQFTTNARQQATQARSSTATRPITIPFELANRLIMLKVRVNNSRPLSFVLDTGDDVAIIDLDRAKALNLQLHGELGVGGAGPGTQMGAFVRGSTFTVEGLEGFSQSVELAVPTAVMSPRFGQDFDGIIGSKFIQEFVIEVDYLARVLRLHDKKKFVYTGTGESIPIQFNHAGHPLVEAEVTPIGSNSFTGRFVIDLGSSLALALYSPFVAENRLLNPDLKTIRALGGGGAGGETTGRFGRVAELKLGKFRVNQPITMFSEDKAGAFASREVLGNIGAQIMNRFKIFLDYDNSRIILEPNEDFGKPYERAFSGLTVRADGQDYRTFRITRVLEDSPGSEAGLQENDIITSIDGNPAFKVNLTKLNEMLEREASYQLTIKRGERTISVKLTPRRLV
jgi:hypothetical protein